MSALEILNDFPFYKNLTDDLKISMKAQTVLKTSVLRMMIAAIKKHVVDFSVFSEAIFYDILGKMIKQRKESHAEYINIRPELAYQELQEIEIIKLYLPKELSNDELTVIIKKVIDEKSATKISDLKTVLDVLKPLIIGKADPAFASNIAKNLLSK